MKRHQALIPLSHDHHHGLVAARRLRRGAQGDATARARSADAFARFFAAETRRHFRDEEEQLFPLLVGVDEPAGELLVRALLDHQHLRALAAELAGALAAGEVPAALMEAVADRLHEHIRFEERTLFPLIESSVPEDSLARLAAATADDGDTPAEPAGTGA